MDAQGRRRCARSSEHAGMTLRLAREKPAVRAASARQHPDRIGYENLYGTSITPSGAQIVAKRGSHADV